MLHVDDVYTGYGRGTVLHHINLHVQVGTVHAIVGHNGAGKTTLLHSIAGLHPTRHGQIRLDGQTITRWPAHRRVRAGIALVPQGRRVWQSLTVAEHLAIASRRRGDTQKWSRAEVLELLPQLAHRLSHRGGQLSGGEQQMLALGRALLTQPKLLLLDEPTEGLAPRIAAQVQDLIGRLVTGMAGAGDLAVLLAAPHPDIAAALAAQVTVLTAGNAATLPGPPDPDQMRTALNPTVSGTETKLTTAEERNP